MKPSYLNLYDTGELFERVKYLKEILSNCELCPNGCFIDRNNNLGKCFSGMDITVSSSGAHFSEEAPLVGRNGSGTIFFTSCSLKCVYCQNYDVSHQRIGRRFSISALADEMLELQKKGVHNINLVTPTHFVPQIVEALSLAIPNGFCLPVVFNCGGYESVKTLRLLEGIIDIYMPDIKYSNNDIAKKYSGINNYWEFASAALKEMHRQVSELKINNLGIAERGLLVRHLVLPNDLSGSEKVLKFISEEISSETYINIMDQYTPEFMAYQFPELNRRITEEEYEKALKTAEKYKLHRVNTN